MLPCKRQQGLQDLSPWATLKQTCDWLNVSLFAYIYFAHNSPFLTKWKSCNLSSTLGHVRSMCSKYYVIELHGSWEKNKLFQHFEDTEKSIQAEMMGPWGEQIHMSNKAQITLPLSVKQSRWLPIVSWTKPSVDLLNSGLHVCQIYVECFGPLHLPYSNNNMTKM